MFDTSRYRPDGVAPKKKFQKPSDAPIDKLTPVTLDTMLLLDYWAYVVNKFPPPTFAYVRSWLQRTNQDVDLCLKAIDYIARRNPKDFENATHTHRATATAINRLLEKRNHNQQEQAA